MKTASSKRQIAFAVVFLKILAVFIAGAAFFAMDWYWGPSADEFVGARAFLRLLLFFLFAMSAVGIMIINLDDKFKPSGAEDFDVVTALFIGMTKEDLAHYGFTGERLIDSYHDPDDDEEFLAFRPFREFQGRAIITFYLVHGQVITWDAETIPMLRVLLREREYMSRWF